MLKNVVCELEHSTLASFLTKLNELTEESSVNILTVANGHIRTRAQLTKRCWTEDWLAKQGLAHPEQCVLCDQEETLQHILTSCVFC